MMVPVEQLLNLTKEIILVMAHFFYHQPSSAKANYYNNRICFLKEI